MAREAIGLSAICEKAAVAPEKIRLMRTRHLGFINDFQGRRDAESAPIEDTKRDLMRGAGYRSETDFLVSLLTSALPEGYRTPPSKKGCDACLAPVLMKLYDRCSVNDENHVSIDTNVGFKRPIALRPRRRFDVLSH